MAAITDQQYKADIYNKLCELLAPYMDDNGGFLPGGIFESVQILLRHRLATPTEDEHQRTLVSLGKRLASERLTLGLSQVDFANKASVPVRAQIAFERGEKEPSLVYLMALSSHGINAHYVITGSRS